MTAYAVDILRQSLEHARNALEHHDHDAKHFLDLSNKSYDAYITCKRRVEALEAAIRQLGGTVA